jgi:integrase
VWKGIRNEAGHAQRQARPLTAPDLRSLLSAIGTARPSDMRDAAMIALGWAGALRRSELVGLDWQERGDGSGFVSIDERGVTITLLRSKTSQAEAVAIVIPAQDMPAACAALAEWARLAALKPGEPVFRRVDHWEHIGADRLTDRSVARIIKARVSLLARMRGFSEQQAAEIAAKCSGHSLRAGYATAAAQADLPTHRIMQHTRHKSAEMVNRYIRESDKWTKSGLQGVGF